MDQNQTSIPTKPGTPFAGGFFAGLIHVGENVFALIVSPKANGDHDDIAWNGSSKRVDGAQSYCDGLANTEAMAAAGSKLAKWARGLNIGGFSDWYLPSVDELELVYRHLKPTTTENYCWARDGISLNSEPQGQPYTPESPKQTDVESFRMDGAEALKSEWYWTSTQHAGDASYAWMQGFGDGYQYCIREDDVCRARAVRRVPIR